MCFCVSVYVCYWSKSERELHISGKTGMNAMSITFTKNLRLKPDNLQMFPCEYSCHTKNYHSSLLLVEHLVALKFWTQGKMLEKRGYKEAALKRTEGYRQRKCRSSVYVRLGL